MFDLGYKSIDMKKNRLCLTLPYWWATGNLDDQEDDKPLIVISVIEFDESKSLEENRRMVSDMLVRWSENLNNLYKEKVKITWNLNIN